MKYFLWKNFRTTVYSSHEELPKQFTDTPYKASMYVHHMNNYHSSLLILVTCKNIIIVMDSEEHLRRRRDGFNGQRGTRID